MRVRIFISFHLVFGISIIGWTQEADYRKIDKHALQAPESATTSFAALAAYLTKPARNDLEKARAIYTWMATHITYDNERYNKNDLAFYTKINLAEDALLYRKSICTGYAQLFQALAEYAGLECEVVQGYVRQPQDIGASLPKINHAWNAIKIQGNWYVMDVTWAAVDEVKTIHELYNTPDFEFYFLTDPSKFVFTHFPKDTQWLLLSEMMDKETFENLPFLFPAAGKAALESVVTKTGLIRTTGDFQVALRTKLLGFIEALVVDYKGNILVEDVTIDYSKKDSNLYINVHLERNGAYLLEIFYETDLILVYKIISS